MYNVHADVTALIAANGTVAASYYYDAFGTIIEQSGNVYNNITYAGYQYDSETQLYYLNSRYYDSKIARFLSEDTYSGKASDPLSLNLYTYCFNNPIRYIDPAGHAAIKVGSKSNDVKEIQKMLDKLGYNTGGADGIFGNNTKSAVIQYQKDHGLSVDGIVGNQTISALKTNIAVQNAPAYIQQLAMSSAIKSQPVSQNKGTNTLAKSNSAPLNGSSTNISSRPSTPAVSAPSASASPQAQQPEGQKKNTTDAGKNSSSQVANSKSGNTSVYNKTAVNKEFGDIDYKDVSDPKGAIKIDPTWIKENITSLTLLPNVQDIFGVKTVSVNKNAIANWEQVFNTLEEDDDLLALVESYNGLFVARHIRHDPKRGISNHSWGTAIDLNASSYPMGTAVDEVKGKDDPNLILYEKVFKPAGFSWGNSYKDPMHYEILKK